MAVEAESALKLDKLSFQYKGSPAPSIKDLHLEVRKGERFGLLGPNGAGKTTLMHLLCGLLLPGSGSIKLFDTDLSESKISHRKRFGFVPQDFSFYPELSPVENLNFFGAWYGLKQDRIMKRSKELLHILGLTEVKDKAVKTFSGGMKRRVNLAIGVIHKPQILFLDEPTVGVDVQTRNAIIAYLKQLNRDGITLFYTSHQMKEAEELCERIALIDEGKIVVSGSIFQLLNDNKEQDLEKLFLKLTGKDFRD
ncbi:MAG: ABC transporter ATP-binding protein [Bacteroidetes bacterium]|nr:MAG: ABC transporter ATP-binding protein [Bacteroidota bacterium]